MPATLSPTRLIRESVPLFGIVFLWALPAAFLPSGAVSTALQSAGVVMALLYAVVRAVWLAGSVPVPRALTDRETLLRTNLVAMAGAGAWFLLAFVAEALLGFASRGGSFVLDPLTALQFALAATGVVTVVFYAVLVGKTVLDRTADGVRQDPSGAPADD